MKFSERTAWVQGANAWTRQAEALKKTGRPYLDLTETNPTRCGLAPVSPEFLKPLSDPANFQYRPDPRGLLEARQAVRDYYARKNTEVPLDRIFFTAGTSEAYSFLFKLLAGPDETVLAPAPGYPLFDLLSGLNDVQLGKYPLVYDGTWQIAPNALEGREGRAIITVNPHNPTGHFTSAGDLQALNGWAVENRAAVISDEVFLDFPVTRGLTRRTLADNAPALTFTLSGISKILGLPQMKLSWIVVSGPEELCEEASNRLEVIADSYLSVGAPVQTALPEWLKEENITAAIRERVSENRSFLAKTLERVPAAALLETEGGWHAVVRVKGEMNDEALALDLLERGLLVHPGYFYDFSENGHLVLSLLPEPGLFQKAARTLSEALQKGGAGA